LEGLIIEYKEFKSPNGNLTKKFKLWNVGASIEGIVFSPNSRTVTIQLYSSYVIKHYSIKNIVTI